MGKKCKYYAESQQETFVPSCCVEDGSPTNDVHPDDIVGDYCQFCGRKIKLKLYTKHPDLLDW